MSRATKQALTLLGVVQGGVNSVRDCFEYGEEMKQLVTAAAKKVEQTVVWWPITGDEISHQEWAKDKLSEWEKVLKDMPQEWTIISNISVSVTILSDLYAKTRSKDKKDMIECLFVPVLAIHDWISPKGTKDYEYADKCVSELYRIIGFDVQGTR